MRGNLSLTWEKIRLIKELSEIFKRNAHSFYLVGGAVRSLLLGQEPLDLDFTTDASPQQVMRMFRRTIPTGIQHGTVTVIWKKEHIEVTTFRQDSTYSNSRHPDTVSFVQSLQEDLSRRDFTINALAYDALENKIYDYFKGRSDLEQKIIRAIGDPYKRFEEDALRILRACRFACVLEFSLEKQTYLAMKQLSYRLKLISAERIYKEFNHILKAKCPQKGLKILEEIGFFKLFLFSKPKSQLWKKLESSLVEAKLYLSQLLIFCLSIEKEERLDFLKSLKFAKHEQKKVEILCPLLEKNLSLTNKHKEARSFLSVLGRENLDLYLASAQKLLSAKEFRIWKTLLISNSHYALNIQELKITGDDLAKKGLKGKEIGEALKKALLIVLDNPMLNQTNELLKHLGL